MVYLKYKKEKIKEKIMKKYLILSVLLLAGACQSFKNQATCYMFLKPGVQQEICNVILPVFSKLQNDHQALSDSIIKFSRIIAMITLPLVAYLIINSKQILSLLYGAKYGEVWLSFSILMFCNPQI